LIRSLQTLDRLSVIGTRVINASKANTIKDLKLLSPTLAGLAKNGQDLAQALQLLPDFPFPANTLSAIKGDYAGFYGGFNLSLDSINQLLKQETGASTTGNATTGTTKTTPTPAQQGLRNLLGTLLGVVGDKNAPRLTLKHVLSILGSLGKGTTR
jgi:phospholipid/cholesterol/gamma-HCH transport system substrate-binding protein